MRYTKANVDKLITRLESWPQGEGRKTIRQLMRDAASMLQVQAGLILMAQQVLHKRHKPHAGQEVKA